MGLPLGDLEFTAPKENFEELAPAEFRIIDSVKLDSAEKLNLD